MNVTDTNNWMTRAIELAQRGEGSVEPNPMVGCVIVKNDQVIGEGCHERFGGPHAEVNALNQADEAARGATMFVTLEPCCHEGKTPPCANAVVEAGPARVVIAQRDPFPKVDGGGIRVLKEAGIEVEVGLCEAAACELNAPYLKLVHTGKPWVIAKWAMTLDGKIATHTGDSQWISNEASREIVHQIRGRVDAIIVGSGTARADDPTLTARPVGPRTATRIVLDSVATLSTESKLVKTIDQAPVIVATSCGAPADNVQRLRDHGCEVIAFDGNTQAERIESLLTQLGDRRMTNVLVEGGSSVLGTFHDINAIDEAHIFIAKKIAGGERAITPVSGHGVDSISLARNLTQSTVREIDGDIYVRGRITK